MTTWLEYQNINMIQRLNWQSKTWQSFALRAKEKKQLSGVLTNFGHLSKTSRTPYILS